MWIKVYNESGDVVDKKTLGEYLRMREGHIFAKKSMAANKVIKKKQF
jgi:hypothetical protein